MLSTDELFIEGGLRPRDTQTGVVVVPGCCNGLDEWRQWLPVAAGRDPTSLGHDPCPEVEFVGDVVRVWQDGFENRDRGQHAGRYVDLPRAALPTLLGGVRTDLVSFLGALAAWAERIGLGTRGPALVETIDRHFEISTPMELDGAL